MELMTLKTQIKTNKFNNIYIFAGVEWKVQQIYIEQMTKVIGRRVYLDSVTELLQKLSSKLFNSVRTLYLLRDDKEYMTNEKAQKRVLETLSDNVLILLVSSVDKRTKFYKTYSESFVEFPMLEHAVLKRYVQKEIRLSDKNTERLMEVCENNYGRILLEIDKIQKCYMSDDMDYNDVFKILISENVIYQPPYDAVFDFVDEVLRRNSARAFDLYEQCKAIGEATLVMLSVLYTNAKQVLQVQSCTHSDTAQIGKTTGLTAWQIKKAKEKVGRYSIGELVYMLKLIRSVEKGIKTGRMEDEYAMQYVLVNVL